MPKSIIFRKTHLHKSDSNDKKLQNEFKLNKTITNFGPNVNQVDLEMLDVFECLNIFLP